jgi:hypothetical protein
MNIDHTDFIGTYSGVYPEGFCQHLIEEFERFSEQGAGSDRLQSEGANRHIKDDYQLFLNGKNFVMEPFGNEDSQRLFFHGLQQCYEEYVKTYSVLKEGRINANHMKLQRTVEGGGYHIWHSEQGNGEQANRCLVYLLYLNSLPEKSNGETEFLYQKRRVNPVENTMVIWPAGFTHPHRGNPVYGDTAKYVVTGWFYYE